MRSLKSCKINSNNRGFVQRETWKIIGNAKDPLLNLWSTATHRFSDMIFKQTPNPHILRTNSRHLNRRSPLKEPILEGNVTGSVYMKSLDDTPYWSVYTRSENQVNKILLNKNFQCALKFAYVCWRRVNTVPSLPSHRLSSMETLLKCLWEGALGGGWRICRLRKKKEVKIRRKRKDKKSRQ